MNETEDEVLHEAPEDALPPAEPGKENSAPAREYGLRLAGEYGLRLARLLGGTTLSALGVVMMLQADVGLEPWSVFHQGLEYTLGITFGTASVVTGAAAVVIAILLGQSFGIGTLFNIVWCGAVIDWLCAWNVISRMTAVPAGLLLLLAGMEVLALGTWLYMSSGLGSGPRDALTVALVCKSGWTVGVCRTGMEILVTLSGWLMGGRVGIGTLAGAGLFGFLLDGTFRLLRFRPGECRQESLRETLRRLRRRELPSPEENAPSPEESARTPEESARTPEESARPKEEK